MNPSNPHARTPELRIVAGGRKSLEEQLLRSVALDLPEADCLSKRLAPAANGSLALVPPSPDGTAAPAPTDESADARRI